MTPEEAITRTLEDRGWRKRFVAAEPRLSEAVEMYRELGFQVRLEPVPAPEKISNGPPKSIERKCHACFEGSEDQYRIIFTKPAGSNGNPTKAARI